MLGKLLDGAIGTGSGSEIGIFTFGLALLTLVLCVIFFIVAAIVAAARRPTDPPNSKHKIFIKLGLISLVSCGVCLLLTAVLCTSH